MARTYFATEILEIGEGNELDNDGFVLNINAKHEAETILGTEEFEPRITMFGRKAREAMDKIREGANVIFTSVKRNPRSWVSENSGKTIEAVELIAEGFKVVKKNQFDDIVKKIVSADQMFDVDLLTFTEDDREKLAKEAGALAGKKDPDSKADI